MSPTKGPHQSIRPRAPGALQGPTARRHPRPIGERGEPASWTGHGPGTSLSWSYLCRATLLEGQGLSICDDPWSTHRRCFRTPAAFCCVGILNRLGGVRPTPPTPRSSGQCPPTFDSFCSNEARQIFGGRSRAPPSGRRRLAKFLASAPASPCRDVPEGVVLRPRRSGDSPHWGSYEGMERRSGPEGPRDLARRA